MKIFYFNSTHWDREWYLPFQHYRFRLVQVLNHLIDTMEADPEYKLFCTDGQSIVLEDYEEVEPERAEKLRNLIKEGRVLAGPWYVQPDELIVSGESLIRNLMMGHRLTAKWGGKPLKYGYGNDIFGHIAQMPQIYGGFDISGSALSRGTGNTDFNHFVWKAPDGTEVMATVGPYDYLRWKMAGKPQEQWPAYFKDFIDTAISRSDAPVVYMSCTADHCYAEARTPQMHKMVREMYPDAELVDASLEEMAEELKQYKDILPVIEGELIRVSEKLDYEVPAWNLNTITSCYSSYYTLKYMNDVCQNRLEKQIEPMIALSNLKGNAINNQYVKIAYRHLIQNHPHDSICGCSLDQVHKDMEYRFDQTIEICDRLRNRFLEYGEDVFENYDDAQEYLLMLYNFQAYDREGYIKADIAFRGNYPKKQNGYYHQPFNNFKILDEKGEEVPYQLLSIHPGVMRRIHNQYAQYQGLCDKFDIYTVALKASIPAMGHTALKVVPVGEKVAYRERMACGTNWAENEFVRLTVESDGRLTVLDKRIGKEYKGLNEFIDNAEYGDGWVHKSPLDDYIVSGIGSKTTISLIHSGLAQTTFRIEKEILLPEKLEDDKLWRSDEKKPLKISYTVTLKQESPVVYVQMEVDNTIKDHRLRLLFPTYTEGDTSFSGQAFCRVERPIGSNLDTLTWKEPDRVEKSINGIIGKQDKQGRGLAFVAANGIHEGGCYADEAATLGVTLYRCFNRVLFNPGSTRPQLQQKLQFAYAIVPMAGGTSYADLLQLQNEVADVDLFHSKYVTAGTPAEKTTSLLKIANKEIAMSIFKTAEEKDGFVLRVFNTTDKEAETKVALNFEVQEVFTANMNEELREKLPLQKTDTGAEITLQFRPWEIRTIKIKV